MEEAPQYYLEEDRWLWRWDGELWVWEEVRFCLWMQVWELVWVGDGFEPELVGEGWWLLDKLADWRWMNEGPYWQERVWDWGCAARKIIGVWVCAGYL